ncbi:type II toxin-antitoxin system RelE/ParE family toxin [Cellvibrio sp.]|uniref:type II toxin-antitoxin system RelE/ParE family toxin n=1 Tax=Cellvibrio sp. TaxID=1965322 RepID=UPI0039647EDC
MQIKWTDLAVKDLDSIEAYITKENSPIVAIDLVLKIINVTELVLINHPKAGRIGRVKNTRELVIDGIPFLVVYRQLNEIQVLRVLHDAQQWPSAD